jgi:hypothetical protein
MADHAGMTRLTLGLEALRAGAGDTLLRAVQKAVAADYEVLGELGRGAQGRILYLAREAGTRHLVALQLTPADGEPRAGEMWLDVLKKLDASVPSGDDKCPRCATALRGWGRFCSQCGADLSGVAPGSGQDTSVDQLLAAVKEAAGHRYDVLGQMDRAEGGGVVYFAREKATDHIVALRLQRRAASAPGRGHYDLGRTMVLKSVVESMVGAETPPGVPGKARSTATAPEPVPPPDEVKPPSRRPGQRDRDVRSLAVGAVALILLVGAAVWWRRATSERNALSGRAVAIDTTAAGLPIMPTPDSVQLTVGGSLPPRTQLAVDGQAMTGRSVWLPPGSHTLSAVAPGFVPASQTLELRPGSAMTWTPQMARSAAPARRPVPSSRLTGKGKAQPADRDTTRPATGEAPPAIARDTSRPAGGLAIHEAPAPASTIPPPDSAPGGPLATAAATCAGLFSNLEWSRALATCEAEANSGSTAAQRTVGTMYERGLATDPNPSAAAVWYAKAAEGGDRVAQYRLGVLLRSGSGVKKDEKAAASWFLKGAEQGESASQLALAQAYDRGKGVKRSRTTAAKWYLKAADQGVSEAQFRLGQLYANGEGGLAKSDPDAVKWFRLAAAQGHRQAQEELAHRR